MSRRDHCCNHDCNQDQRSRGGGDSMKTPHKHAELIKAWADGAEIQWYDNGVREHRWKDCGQVFDWSSPVAFRIKPEPKPAVVRMIEIDLASVSWRADYPNLKLTFDGETGKLKSAEVL